MFFARIAIAPSFPGLQCFLEGRGFKQWTGDDSKALMKVCFQFNLSIIVTAHKRKSDETKWNWMGGNSPKGLPLYKFLKCAQTTPE